MNEYMACLEKSDSALSHFLTDPLLYHVNPVLQNLVIEVLSDRFLQHFFWADLDHRAKLRHSVEEEDEQAKQDLQHKNHSQTYVKLLRLKTLSLTTRRVLICFMYC